MRKYGRLLGAAATTLLVASHLSCTSESTPPPVPTEIAASSPVTQTAVVGTGVASRPSVVVTAAGGVPLRGAVVTFTMASGGGSLEGAVQTTDANGVATVTDWTLGTQAGENAVTAQVGSLDPVVFTATGTPDRAATVKLSADSIHFDALGDTVRLSASVADRYNNALASPQLQWSAADPSIASIDAAGLLTSRARGKTAIRVISDTAQTGGVSVVAPRAAGIAITPDAGTIDALGDTLRLVAAARDRNGNVLHEAQISWSSLETAIASVAATGTVVSKAIGVAHIVATAETVADTASVTVRQGVAGVFITPANHSLVAGSSIQLTAEARDSKGARIEDAVFTWTTSDAEAVEISASGLARGRRARPATITASAAGNTGSALITVVPGPPRSLVKSGGDGQTGLAGAELPQPVAVRVVDAFDNGVPGVNVTWAAAAGSGSANTAGATDASGASTARWTLGPNKGTHTIQASSGALAGSPTAFAATASPNGRITGQLTTIGSPHAQSTAAASRARLEAITPGAFGAGGSRARPGTRGRAPLEQGAREEVTRQQYVPGSLIVRFRGPALGVNDVGPRSLSRDATARAVVREMRSRLEPAARSGRVRIAGTSPAILAARVRVDPAQVEAARTELLKDPAVLSVEPDALASAFEEPRPMRTSLVPSTLPNDTTYYRQAWHYSMVDLPEAWALTTGSRNVLVAVVDDGIRFDHPGIAANLTNDGYDFVSTGLFPVCGVQRDNAGDGDGYDPNPTVPARYNCSEAGGLSSAGGHGLHVAGTIGAVGNDVEGSTGVNWSVRIRPVRVLGVSGQGTFYDIAQGILYSAGLLADNGAGGHVPPVPAARIINVSLGASGDVAVLRDAVRAASAAGALVVAAAGNTPSSNPHYPAAYPEALSVSAVGPDMKLASYSTFGPTVDLAAPGGDASDCAGTCGVWSTTWNFAQNKPTYSYNQGSSMAAPHVSGVAALLLAAEPSLSAEQLRERLTAYAVDVGAPGRDDQYGAGLVNARNSLTRSVGPSRALYAALYDAQTGTLLRAMRAAADATYAFTGLDNGSYFVFAGEDEAGDGVIGVPGRRWGAHGRGPTQPTEVRVSGAGTYPAPVSAAWPWETEPNDGPASAGRLVDFGYVQGDISSTTDVDWFVITLPGGQYVFETSAWDGVCGYALEADTILELIGLVGAAVEVNDNVDAGPSPRDRCSRIARTLTAGSYHLKVTASYAGHYRLAVRRVQ
jgi:subtilisin family serine protease